MEAQLQTLALIAAMSQKSLRETLDADDFTGRERLLAQALKDGKSKQAREDVQRWLADYGIRWDGTTDIGEAILLSLKETVAIRMARAQLAGLGRTLRYPNVAGPKAVAEALKIVQALEGIKNGEFQSGSGGWSPRPRSGS